MKIKYLCLAICLAWSGVAAAETAQQASAVSVAAAKSDDELRAKEIELKAQEKSQAMIGRYLALHEKTITGQQKSIDWWIAAMGLILALAGYVQFKFMQSKQKEWEEERDKLRDEMKQELDNVKNLKISVQNHHDESQELIARMRQMSPSSPDKILSDEQIAQNQAGIEAAEKLVDNREIPLIEQLRAQAILLSNNAEKSQQYHDYEKAFHAWYAVWLQDENGADACFELGYIAQLLYQHAQRTQQLYWLSEIEKWYGKALQIEPDFYDAAYNLGLALYDEAQVLQQENKLLEGHTKCQEAGQYYQQALRSKPDFHEAANDWGNALSHEAQALQQENKLPEAYEKWQQAKQCYERALQIKPDFYDAAYNWGLALSHEAQALQQENKLPEAYEKWQQAGQRYEQALQIKPDFYDAAYNWGLALSHEVQALRKENKLPEAYEKWQQAKQCYERALQIKPDFYDAAYNWGLALSHEAEALQQENKLPEAYEKWQQAGQRYEQALQIKPDFHEAANNWGLALSHEAQALQQEARLLEAYEKWQQAGQRYEQALQIKPDFHEAAYNWGVTLSREAKALQQENELPKAYKKWQQAGQYYAQTLQIRPDYYKAALNWMSNLLHMYQAIKAENPDKAIELLQQTKQIAHDFLEKYPQYAPELAYNRACLFALENYPPQAIEQLKLAQQSDNFPDKAHILQDKDLDNIRETPEFQAWLKEAFPNAE